MLQDMELFSRSSPAPVLLPSLKPAGRRFRPFERGEGDQAMQTVTGHIRIQRGGSITVSGYTTDGWAPATVQIVMRGGGVMFIAYMTPDEARQLAASVAAAATAADLPVPETI